MATCLPFFLASQELAILAGQRGSRLLIVAGVDAMGRSGLEDLSRIADDAGVRLVMIFDRLRGDAAAIVGDTDSAAVFMMMGNTADAEAAARFIGRGHVFRLGQVSKQLTESTTDGESYSHTFQEGSSRSHQNGESTSMNRGRSTTRSQGVNVSPGFLSVGLSGRGISLNGSGASRSLNKGISVADSWSESLSRSSSLTVGSSTSRSEQAGTSRSTGTSEARGEVFQRTYDYVVEPTTIQRLDPTTFILCDRIGKRIVAGDCNPVISVIDRVSNRPVR